MKISQFELPPNIQERKPTGSIYIQDSLEKAELSMTQTQDTNTISSGIPYADAEPPVIKVEPAAVRILGEFTKLNKHKIQDVVEVEYPLTGDFTD